MVARSRLFRSTARSSRPDIFDCNRHTHHSTLWRTNFTESASRFPWPSRATHPKTLGNNVNDNELY